MEVHRITGLSILGSTVGMQISEQIHSHGWHLVFTALLAIIGVVRTLASEESCKPKIDAAIKHFTQGKSS